MGSIDTLTDLDGRVHGLLVELSDAIAAARAEGVLSDELPQRYRLLSSYVNTAVHGYAASAAPPSAQTIATSIDKERDRRINGGFEWNGMTFQSRASDRENILGSAQLAMAAIGQGAQPGDYHWANPDGDFEWILADNSKINLDAWDVMGLFQTGVAFKAALTFYARALKDAVLEAEDPTSIDVVNGWPFSPEIAQPDEEPAVDPN